MEAPTSDNNAAVYIDNELVRRTRCGDVSAFEELFNRNQKRVYNIALQMLKDESEASDAAQEVFVRAYQHINTLKSDAAFVTWLKTMTINKCRDIIRKHGSNRTQSLDAPAEMNDGETLNREVPDWSNNPERSLDRKQTGEFVQKAIFSLSPDYREVVTLFYIDGADIAEIAKVLNCPIGTVKSRLSRARAELKRKLEFYVKGEVGGS